MVTLTHIVSCDGSGRSTLFMAVSVVPDNNAAATF